MRPLFKPQLDLKRRRKNKQTRGFWGATLGSHLPLPFLN